MQPNKIDEAQAEPATQPDQESGEHAESSPHNMEQLRALVEFLRSSGIAEFDLERPNLKLRLRFEGATQAAPAAPASLDLARLAQMMAASQAPLAGAAGTSAMPTIHAEAALETPAAPVPDAVKHHIVKSPLVGTVYESSAPGAAPFVRVGDQVEVGQVLCIVEAMKLMNEIEADAAGEIVARILVNGQPVEYGQPLFEIKTR